MSRALHGILALATLALVASCTRAPHPRPTVVTSTSAGSRAALPHPPDDGGNDDGRYVPYPAPPAPDARVVAEGFARAWAHPMLPAAQWRAGVASYCSIAYADQLLSVDPARVPATAVTGPATATSSTATVVVWAVPTDAGTITVTTALLAKRWLVTTVAPPEAVR